MKVGAEERSEVRSCLGHNEVIDVEELCDAVERGFAARVAGMRPGLEGCFFGGDPGDDVSGFVFAH